MISVSSFVEEKVWLDKPKYDAAERRYYEKLAQSSELAKASISTNVKDPLVIVGAGTELDDEVPFNLNLNHKPDQKISTKISKDNIAKENEENIMPNQIDKNLPIPLQLQLMAKSPEPEQIITLKFKSDIDTSTLLKQKMEESYSTANKKILSSSIKGPTIEKPIKIKSEDDKSTKLEIALEKPQSTIDHAQDVVKVDKQDSIELIIPSDNDPQAEDQAKKDSKKKKRHKKERHRDKKGVSQNSNSWNSLAGEVAKARQHIKNSLQCIDDIAVTSNTVSVEITNRLSTLEKENIELKNQVSELSELLKKMELRISSVEKNNAGVSAKPADKVSAPAPHPKKDDAEDDDGVDLFGSDSEEEDTEAAKIKEQRLAEYAAKKAKKPVLIAKSNIILDVKPWDDETNMKELEVEVRKITTDGLVWGASKLVPLAYGIHKLQISCVVEDEKVSVDWLQETIQEIEAYVQSVDIAAFNKV